MGKINKYIAVIIQLVAMTIMLFHLSVPHHNDYGHYGQMDEHVCCQVEKQVCQQNEHSSHEDNCSDHCHCIGCHIMEDIPYLVDNHLQFALFTGEYSLFHTYFEYEPESYCKSSGLVQTDLLKIPLRGPPAIHFA